MNIAIINNLYEPFERGGAERICRLQKIGLEKNGHKVIVVCTCPNDKKISNGLELFYLKSYFYNLNKIPIFIRLFWHISDTFNFIKSFKIIKILKNQKVDLVITHNLTGLGKISAYFIAKQFKHIHVLHDINLLHPSGLMYLGKEGILNTIFAKAYQYVIKSYFQKTKIIISPSTWLLDLHTKQGFFHNIKNLVIENPIEIIKNAKKVKSSIFTFLYVGLISEHKGINVLIKAWNLLQKENMADCYLNIVGESTNEEYLDKIKKMPNTKYFGKLRHEDLEKYFNTADCLVLPSICYENSPTVLYEAASYGICTLSSDIGGSKELALKLNGLVFKAGDALSLRQQMIYILSNRTEVESLGFASRAVIGNFNLNRYIKNLNKIIT